MKTRDRWLEDLIEKQTTRIIEAIQATALRKSTATRKLETTRIVRDIVARAWNEEDGSESKKREVLRAFDTVIAQMEVSHDGT